MILTISDNADLSAPLHVFMNTTNSSEIATGIPTATPSLNTTQIYVENLAVENALGYVVIAAAAFLVLLL